MILRHAALTCSSEEKADRFYKDVLGLKKMAPKRLPLSLSKSIFNIDSELIIINYLNEQVHFEIFIHSQHAKRVKRIEHLCLQVDELEPFLEKCRTLELRIVQVPKGQKLLTFVSDFDDNLFEISGK